ncbi:anaphase-promoting complex subunit 5-like isoform X2 [Panonychus citri]|nr:anaphase-promoting complex subunit 5-like isoform X2 [Panonychus citri]
MDPTIDFHPTPYKLCLTLLATCFTDRKVELTYREIGRFCIIIMKLIHGLELSYSQLRSFLLKSGLSKMILQLFEERMVNLVNEDVGSIIDLIAKSKPYISTGSNLTHSYTLGINKSSILGLFLRKMAIFFDRLDFMKIVQLYESLQLYYKEGQKKDMTDPGHGELRYKCINPSKQINLIQINEKQALSPLELVKLIQSCYPSGRPNPTQLKNLKSTYFLQYLNYLRLNEYSAAQDFLFAYFDGYVDQETRCWAALNQAMFHLHFNRYRLAMESVKECISSAQEANDERCMEFAFLLIAKIIINEKNPSYTEEDIIRFLHHLQTRATELDLHHLSAIACLHLESLIGPMAEYERNSRPDGTANPELLAVKHSLPEILMMSYAIKSDQYATLGATHLTLLYSQALLDLHLVQHVGDGLVYRVNENTCIAIRNIALHLWRNLGHYNLARDMITSLAANLFSFYQTNITSIWEQALAEIQFEHYYLKDEWSKAENFVKKIQLYDKTEASIRAAELYLKQKRRDEAFATISKLQNSPEYHQLSAYTQVRIMIMKGNVLNDFETLFEALEIVKKHKFGLLETRCVLEIARLEYKFGQKSKSLTLLRSVFITVLGYATRREVAFAHYLEALNCRSFGHLDAALNSNETAISIYRQIEDREYCRKAYSLHAQLYNEKKDFEKRNFYALQVRKLLAT